MRVLFYLENLKTDNSLTFVFTYKRFHSRDQFFMSRKRRSSRGRSFVEAQLRERGTVVGLWLQNDAKYSQAVLYNL